MEIYKPNAFVFSAKYRVLRHVVFWFVYVIIFTILWEGLRGTLSKKFFVHAFWVPVNILYCYPVMYWLLPKYLLKGKYAQFTIIMLLWAIAGWYLNALFRAFIFIPLQEFINFIPIGTNPWQPGSYLAMCTTTGIASMIVLFKYWVKKQRDWMQAEKEKIIICTNQNTTCRNTRYFAENTKAFGL